MHNIDMDREISFIRNVVRRGEDLAITVPRDLRDLFKDKRVKVIVLESC